MGAYTTSATQPWTVRGSNPARRVCKTRLRPAPRPIIRPQGSFRRALRPNAEAGGIEPHTLSSISRFRNGARHLTRTTSINPIARWPAGLRLRLHSDQHAPALRIASVSNRTDFHPPLVFKTRPATGRGHYPKAASRGIEPHRPSPATRFPSVAYHRAGLLAK